MPNLSSYLLKVCRVVIMVLGAEKEAGIWIDPGSLVVENSLQGPL